LHLNAAAFTVPVRPPDGTFNALSAPFTLEGTFAGYSDEAMTNRVFAVSIRGSGVAEFTWSQFQDNTYVAAGAGGPIYHLIWPVEFPWAFGSIGPAGMSGDSGVDQVGALRMGGSGADIWGTADAFGFTWRALVGDGEIAAKIVSQSNTNAYAKAGLMIRAPGSDPSAAHVLLDVKPDHEVEFMTRAQTGGSTTYIAGARLPTPDVWLKLRRSDDQVTAFVSSDGATWTAVGSVSFASGWADAGFAVTSHDDTAVNQAVFDKWNVTETVPAGAGPLDRGDWTAVATESSPSDPAANALDGNPDTRFSTGSAQHDSQGFIVSWPSDRTIGRIQMDVGPSTNDYPRMCGIWVKDTAGTVTFVNCAANPSGNVEVSFPPIPASKIEVWQWGTSDWWWSIAEFNVFER